MNKVFVTLVGASAIAVSAAGYAGGFDSNASAAADNNSAGFYINGNVGYGHTDYLKKYKSKGDLSIDHSSFAWSANVGYQFNPYVAVEAGYMALPYTKWVVHASSGTLRFKTDAITFALKGIYPINEQFDVFGKAGLAYESRTDALEGNGHKYTVHDHDHPIAPLFGLGVDYNITQNWAVSLQGVATLKADDDFPATYTGLVGVSYKFS